LPLSDGIVEELTSKCASGFGCAASFSSCAQGVLAEHAVPDATIKCLIQSLTMPNSGSAAGSCPMSTASGATSGSHSSGSSTGTGGAGTSGPGTGVTTTGTGTGTGTTGTGATGAGGSGGACATNADCPSGEYCVN